MPVSRAALLRQAAVWAAGRGLLTLGGPFNLDYEDAYGVLVEGRDRPPVMLCGHTPAYYQGFFEGTGSRRCGETTSPTRSRWTRSPRR